MKARRLFGIAAATTALTLGAAAAATAAPAHPDLTGPYAPFDNCPADAPAMGTAPPRLAMGCVASIVNGGSFKIGSQTVKITHPVTTQFGVVSALDADGKQKFEVVPPADGHALDAKPEWVPGGLLGIMTPSSVPEPLHGLLVNLLEKNELLGVSATVEQAGPISDFAILPPAFTLPVKIHLHNVLLGSKCYIGSDKNPIVLKPAASLTGDPAPSLSIGTIAGYTSADILAIDNLTLKDETFSVPEASGCGLLGLGLLDSAINSKLGLPSPSGQNAAIFTDAKALFLDVFSDNQQDDLLQILATQPEVTTLNP